MGRPRSSIAIAHPKTGKMRGISTVYRFTMLPAYVVSPGADTAVTVATVY